MLLEEGFASTHHYSASLNPAANLLFAAESSAKNAKRGIWHNHNEIDDITKGTEEITVEERSAGNEKPYINLDQFIIHIIYCFFNIKIISIRIRFCRINS